MNERLHCPLCGFEFEKTNTVCTHGCPMGRFCKLIKCPNCQYEFPETSRPLAWLAKLLHPATMPVHGAKNLTQAEAGTTMEFVGMAPGAEGRARSLAVYAVRVATEAPLLRHSCRGDGVGARR